MMVGEKSKWENVFTQAANNNIVVIAPRKVKVWQHLSDYHFL